MLTEAGCPSQLPSIHPRTASVTRAVHTHPACGSSPQPRHATAPSSRQCFKKYQLRQNAHNKEFTTLTRFRSTGYWHEVHCVCQVSSVVSDSLRPRGPWPARLLCPRIPRQEHWSGLPYPPPGDPPAPGMEPASPVTPVSEVDSSLLSHRGSLPQ